MGMGLPKPSSSSLGSLPKNPPTVSLEGYELLPRVAVVDLDETCWEHFGLDHKPAFSPPFCWCPEQRAVVDTTGRKVKIFPELPQVLLALHDAGVKIAIASHNGKPEWCREVLESCVLDEARGLTWGNLVQDELFVVEHEGEFWPGKNSHYKHIREKVLCDYSEMLVFDDLRSICKQAWELGAQSVRCLGGISVARLIEGLDQLNGNTQGMGTKRKR